MAIFAGFRPFLTKGSTLNGAQNLFFADELAGAHYILNTTSIYGISSPALIGESVAGILDEKTKNPLFGPELIPAASEWFSVLDSGNWNVNTETSTATVVNAASSGDDLRLRLLTGSYVGQLFAVTMTVESITAGSVLVTSSRGGASRTAITSPGTYNYYINITLTGAGALNIDINAGGVSCVVSNISVREILGNAAFQPSVTLRPLLGRAPKSKRNVMQDTTTAPIATNGTIEIADNILVDNTIIPMWSFAIGEGTLPINTNVSRERPNAATVNLDFIHSMYVKPGNNRYIYFTSNASGSQNNVGSKFRYDTELDTITSLFIGNVGNVSQNVQNLGSGLYRVSIRQNQLTNAGTKTIGAYCSSTSEITSGSAYILPTVPTEDVFSVGGWQCEMVSATATSPSPYQQTISNIDTTETGFVSFPFIRFDLADDRLDTILPQAVNGNIVIAGRNGSIIEPVSYSANTTFQLGPTTYTGGMSGILRGIGDVVGYSLIDRSVSNIEKTQLIDYYKSRGAKGLLVPGPELIVNGDFSDGDTGWTEAVPTVIISDGTAKITRVPGTFDAVLEQVISNPITRNFTRNFMVEFDVIASSGTCAIRNSGATLIQMTFPLGRNSFVFTVFGNFGFRLLQRSEGATLEVDNISVRELRPEEEW